MSEPEPNQDLASITERIKKTKALVQQAEAAGIRVPGQQVFGMVERSAQEAIDSVIGHEPDDTTLLDFLKSHQEFTTSVLAPISRRYASTMFPGEDETQARLAVGAIHPLYDPWTVADSFLQNQLASDERLSSLYLRETDPLGVLPYIVETNQKKGGWTGALDSIKDKLGRPLGGLADLLSWPLEQSEELIGTHFIWNDISDPALRKALARNISWQSGWAGLASPDERNRMRSAEREARRILASGLTGETAADAMEQWFSTPEGRIGGKAALVSFFAELTGDPLNLAFLLPTSAVAGKVSPVISKLPRILGPGFAGFKETTGLKGWHAIREALKANEMLWQGGAIKLAPRGPFAYLFSKTPARAASEVTRQFSLRLAREGLKIEHIGALDESMRAGKLTDDALRFFGPGLFESPDVARVAQLAKKGNFSIMDHLLPKDPKAQMEVLEILRTVDPKEASALLRVGVEAIVEAGAKDLWDDFLKIPTWVKRAEKVGAWEKRLMGFFTLGRPGFVALNIANNFFTFAWHAAMHPIDMTKSLAGATYALGPGRGRILPSTERLIRSVDADPGAMIRAWSSITSDVDTLSLAAKKALKTDTPEDWSKALKRMRSAADFPAKMQRDFQIQSLLALPVTAAGGVDRWARIATGEFALRQQLHMTLAPRAILAGPLADFRSTLVNLGVDSRVAEQAERKAISALRNAALKEGKPIFRREVSNKIISDAMTEMAIGKPGAGLSGTDIFLRWSQTKGYSGGLDSWLIMRDYLAEIGRLDDVVGKLDDITPTQRDAMLEQVEDEVTGFDRWQSRLTNGDPVIRETPSYVAATGATEDSIREATTDNMLHLDRMLSQIFWGSWKGSAQEGQFYQAADKALNLFEDLAEIRRVRIQTLIDAGDVKAAVRPLWPTYFEKRDAAWDEIYQTGRKLLGERNVAAAQKMDAWYANLKNIHEQQAEALARAVAEDTSEAWIAAGAKMRNIFAKQARQNASKKIFGLPVNNPAKNLTQVRGSAALSDNVADLMQFARQAFREGLGETPENYALGISRAGAFKPGLTQDQIKGLTGLIDETAMNLTAVREQVIGQAQALVDHVMLNYNKQYGLDALMQIVFPYEFFPTRSIAHWSTRLASHPAAFAKLTQFITRPAEYAQQYGMPERLQFAIPVPMPGLGEFFSKIPGIGSKVATNQWGSVYWIDPMAVLFPFTYDMRQDFEDEKARSTPMGKILDWSENYVPMGLSPFAKIIGSESGLLDKDAWEYGLFRGGPFGISPTIAGRAAALWLQTGDDSGVPDEEKDNYTEGGFFSSDFLLRITGIAPDRWDDYRTERAGAALIATGELIPGVDRTTQRQRFYVEMQQKSGPLWKKAQKYARSTQFLADLTGYAFARITPVLEGELKIRTGERHLYLEAARRGELQDFFEKYPEYEVYRTAVQGISDPEEKDKAVATELYYQAVEKYVEAPYKHQLDQLDQLLDDLSTVDPQTSDIQKQRSVLIAARKSIRDEQNELRSMLDAAFDDRETELSLFRDPKNRALMGVESLYYDIPSLMGDDAEFTEEEAGKIQQAVLRALSGDERIWNSLRDEMLIKAKGRTDLPNEKITAAQELLLSRFPAFDPSIHSASDWHDLTVASLQSKFGSSQEIAQAIRDGNYDKIAEIQSARQRELEGLHELARSRLTRYEIEGFLARNRRPQTPEEKQFEQAEYLFDLWMALVGEGSPLSSRQQAAVSAYFRQHPLIQAHYPSEAIDARTLSVQGVVDILRRREIWSTYYDIEDVDSQLDYIHGVADELNEINGRLGLRPLTVIDPRPLPPDPLGGGTGTEDFMGEDERTALIELAREEGMSDLDIQAMLEDWAAETGQLTPDEIDRLIDMSDRRGY